MLGDFFAILIVAGLLWAIMLTTKALIVAMVSNSDHKKSSNLFAIIAAVVSLIVSCFLYYLDLEKTSA
ncbi:MAG: hypothetical protein GY947_09975 [Rhodobacteraceae bacterium]|nr:hypothetical protein [Paracoccaceae bacterium]